MTPPRHLMEQDQMELVAVLRGYADPADFTEAFDLKQCDVCHKWGEWGVDVTPSPVIGDRGHYCLAHQPTEKEDGS